MRRKLTLLILILCGFIGSSAKADTIELFFSPDSLIQTGENNNFTYPQTQTITINPEISLPVKTVYINSASTSLNVSDAMVSIESNNNLYLGSISEEELKFADLITAFDDPIKSSPLHKISNFENVLYDKQIIYKNGNPLIVLSILPVTIDENNNFILNSKITINTDSPINAAYNSKTLHAALEDFSINPTNNFSNKVTATNGQASAKYVIITSNELAPSFQEMVDFKNAIGIPTIIKLVDSIYANYTGIDQVEQIRNYLIEFYNNGGEYALIGGNDVVVPVRYLYYYNTSIEPSNRYNLMPSDLYYADLDGDWDVDGDGIWGEPTHDNPDIVPELMVGRLPVMTTTAVENYVAKLIIYQTNPGFGDFDYLENILIFSSDQMRDYPSMGQHGYIANELPANVSADTLQSIEMPNGSDLAPTNPNGSAGITKISEGFGMVHILAHGRTDGFRVTASGYNNWPATMILSTPQSYPHGTLLDLEPNGKVSLYYSLSCQVGGFDLDSTNGEPSDWSFVETAMAAKDAGAIGMVGYSRWGWVYSSYYLEASYTKHLYGEADGNPVKAMYYSWLDYPYYRDLIYGQNYFGDPTLKFYQTKPTRLVIEVSAAKGGASFYASINNTPIPNTTVTITVDGQIIEEGLTGENGSFDSKVDLLYGHDYYLTAYADNGSTIFRSVYSPTLILDAEEDSDLQLPQAYSLAQNYPNPFNPSTTINYNLPKADETTLEIYNILGQLITKYNFGRQPAGSYSYQWNGTDENNQPLSSGIYFYRLRTTEFIETKKMTLLK